MANWKTSKVSMPQTGAGLIGISHDENIAGIEMDPRAFIIAALVFVLAVKLLDVLISK